MTFVHFITKERIILNSIPSTSNPERTTFSQRHQLEPPHARRLPSQHVTQASEEIPFKQPTISDFESGLHYDECGCTFMISDLPLSDQIQNHSSSSNRQDLLKQSVFGCIVRAYQKLFAEGDTAGAESYERKRRSQTEFVQNRTLRLPFTYTISYTESQRTQSASITICLFWTSNRSFSTIRFDKSEPPRVMTSSDIKKYASLIYETLHSDLKSFIDQTYADALKFGITPDYYSPTKPGIIPAYYDIPNL